MIVESWIEMNACAHSIHGFENVTSVSKHAHPQCLQRAAVRNRSGDVDVSLNLNTDIPHVSGAQGKPHYEHGLVHLFHFPALV